MLNYGTKIDNDDTSAGVVVADEYNSLMQEQKNSVTPFLNLNAKDNKQQAKAIDIASKAMFYTDIGTANAIQLSRGATADVTETLFDGMVLIFTPSNANTGATTLKVKTLTAKSLFYAGAELVAGYLNTTSKYIAVYDLANDRFNVDVIAGGSAKQPYKIKDAVNVDEAVSKAQMEAEIANGGKVLNVWEYSSSTELVIGTTAFADTEYTLTITPRSVNSRFLVMYNVNARLNGGKGLGCRFTRNGTALEVGHYYETYAGGASNDMRQMSSKTMLDAPNTASDITYTLQMASYGSSATINENGNMLSNIIIFELGA